MRDQMRGSDNEFRSSTIDIKD